MRDMENISQVMVWMQIEENHPECATGSGRVGTDETALIERVDSSSSGAAGDRLHVHPRSSKITSCPGDTRTPHPVLMFQWRSQNK